MIVVGGGASGLMAAGRAAERGKRVLLLGEKKKNWGEKLRISGGGRCNITNAEEDPRVFLRAYGKAEQFFIFPVLAIRGERHVLIFESRGLPLVVEARKRAFPKTQKQRMW